MKKAIVIVVFLFILKPIFPVIEYILNYDYIIKELCENKAKPEMSCNGKCHLMKELAKVSENENPASQDEKLITIVLENLFFQTAEKVSFSNLTYVNSKKIRVTYCNLYSHNYFFSLFHPPIV